MVRGRLWFGVGALGSLLLCIALLPTVAQAAQSTDFSLQVTPSPLVTTVKPGIKTQVQLRIRNGGNGSEALKIEPRSFHLSDNSTSISLLDTTPPDISSWISFSQPTFTIQAGQWITENITFNVPKSAGFSYSFALVINRQQVQEPSSGGRAINGSVAVFTLINVDRPGATSQLQVAHFTASKRLYEYLPASFSVQFHNTGNTIAQPFGNIFVQRGAHDQTPMATLTVNATHGYILPGTARTVTATWNDGFPSYKTITNADGTTSQKLVWNWGNLSRLRIGRYTARLVAVYSQAGRDVPIEGTLTFWVIPWKLLFIPLALLGLIGFGLFTIFRSIYRGAKRQNGKRRTKKPSVDESEDQPSDKSSS